MERLIRHTIEEKTEIIHIVEHSELSIIKTLEEIQVPRSTFYRWYRLCQECGIEGLAEKKPTAKQFWNRIPGTVRQQIVKLALKHTDESPRQLAWRFVDKKGYFISESSVYRILKGYDLVKSPVFEVISAKDKFDNPTKRVNEMWQTAHVCAFHSISGS